MRVATFTNRRWTVTTVDRTAQAVSSPHVTIVRGATVAAWIEQAEPMSEVRVAVLSPGGSLSRVRTLEVSERLSPLILGHAGRDSRVLAWTDITASESRVRAVRYRDGSWGSIATVASALKPQSVDELRFGRRDPSALTWMLGDSRNGRAVPYHARGVGDGWARERRGAA